MTWLTEFFSNMKDKSAALICLALGTLLAVVSVSGLPVDSQTTFRENDSPGSIFLGTIAVVFVASGLWITLSKNRSQVDSQKKSRIVEDLQDELRQRKEEIFNLKQSISRTINILDRSTKDDITLEAVKILQGISSDIADFTLIQGHRKQAGEWVSQRIDKWSKLLSTDDYLDDGVNSANIQTFREEISQHLELLCENIIFDQNACPSLVNQQLSHSVGSPITYKRALQFIEAEAERELDMKSNVLHEEAVRELRRHISNFIELSTL